MNVPAEAFADLERLYAALEEETRRRNPRCELSGRCCDFKRSGHELFATDLETAYARAHGGASPPAAAPGDCPFHRGGRCHLRDGRPLGCRVYFCDPAYRDAMPEVAERHHRGVVAIHERHGLEYRYRRFVEAIAEEDPS